MKKLTVGILLSLLIGTSIMNEAPKVVNHITAQIEQAGDNLISEMTASIS